MRDQNISYTGETGEDLDHTFDTVVKQKCYKGKDRWRSRSRIRYSRVEQKCHKGKDNEDLDHTFDTDVEQKWEKSSRSRNHNTTKTYVCRLVRVMKKINKFYVINLTVLIFLICW